MKERTYKQTWNEFQFRSLKPLNKGLQRCRIIQRCQLCKLFGVPTGLQEPKLGIIHHHSFTEYAIEVHVYVSAVNREKDSGETGGDDVVLGNSNGPHLFGQSSLCADGVLTHITLPDDTSGECLPQLSISMEGSMVECEVRFITLFK